LAEGQVLWIENDIRALLSAVNQLLDECFSSAVRVASETGVS
jgi:hypothetical protein